jgi:DNA-binding NarL/FixJ family response regulator
MSAHRKPETIRIGIMAEEPLRLAGLSTVFDQPGYEGRAKLAPVPGTMLELLANPALKYLVVDMQSSSSGMKALETVRRARPDLRMIVIGPAGNEELVMKCIVAGARAYLDLSASPEVVREAVEIVTHGSIWAPRRTLSKLIDRLLDNPEPSSVATSSTQLTSREREVMELIMKARSNREISLQLGIEERTVRAHLARLMRKAGVDNRIKLSMSGLGRSLAKREQTSRSTGAERARAH